MLVQILDLPEGWIPDTEPALRNTTPIAPQSCEDLLSNAPVPQGEVGVAFVKPAEQLRLQHWIALYADEPAAIATMGITGWSVGMCPRYTQGEMRVDQSSFEWVSDANSVVGRSIITTDLATGTQAYGWELIRRAGPVISTLVMYGAGGGTYASDAYLSDEFIAVGMNRLFGVKPGPPIRVVATTTTLPAAAVADTCPQGGVDNIEPWDGVPTACESIRLMQSYLLACGSYLEVDGQYGPGTEAAVIEFKSAFGLTADAVVGPSPWKLLKECGTTGSAAGCPLAGIDSIVIGDGYCRSVYIMQVYLARCGYYTDESWYFSETTLMAVTAFQRDQGLEADGAVGRGTWRELEACGYW